MTEVFVELPFERGLRLSGQVVEGGAPLSGARLSVGAVSASADHLLVTEHGYESAQIPLNITPGEHLEGLVVRLQPAPPDAPDQ